MHDDREGEPQIGPPPLRRLERRLEIVGTLEPEELDLQAEQSGGVLHLSVVSNCSRPGRLGRIPERFHASNSWRGLLEQGQALRCEAGWREWEGTARRALGSTCASTAGPASWWRG